MRQICKPETEENNVLELEPLHQQLKTHMQKIIDNPGILLDTGATYQTGFLDGRWVGKARSN